MDENQYVYPSWKDRLKYFFQGKLQLKKRFILIFLLIIGVSIYIFLNTPPFDFPKNQIFTISSGESLQEITEALDTRGVVRSPFIFRTVVILLGGEKRVIAGDYLLDKRQGPVDLAYRFVRGDFNLDARRITIPEGWNIFQIGDYLEKNLVNFNKTEFLNLAKDKEGYLFPDTYFLTPTAKPEAVISLLNNTFDQKIISIPGIATSTRKLSDVIIMASILEGEARTTESRKIISGILWKRLSVGMPLQVDATFSYINGKNTYELTLDDLKIDSLYNTYKYAGLPPGPISNPGTDSIEAALHPINTKYLYFLSSKSGEMYYARTFEEHKRNRELYLNK